MTQFYSEVFNWLGHIGVAIYLFSYGLLQAGILRGSGYLYTILNLAAATLVLFSLTVSFNLSAAIIQIFWIVISLVGLTRMFISNYRIRFSEQELKLTENVLSEAPRVMLRRFLNAGNLFTAPIGFVLTTEGEPVRQLSYVLTGRATVSCGDKIIGSVSEAFVGEMNVLREGPASATVIVDEEATIFSVPAETLNALRKKDSDFAILIERALSEDTGRKLLAANVRLSGHKSEHTAVDAAAE